LLLHPTTSPPNRVTRQEQQQQEQEQQQQQQQQPAMELFVVLPATACSGSTSRTVSLEVGPAASTTVRELKEAIQLRSAQVYGASSSSSSSSWRGEEKEEEEEGLGGIPAALQRLTLGGWHLRDEQTLAECAVVGYVNKAWMDCVCVSSAHACFCLL